MGVRFTARELFDAGFKVVGDVAVPREPGDVPPSTPAGGRGKYGAKPTVYNGRRYHSKSEAARAADLDVMLDAGVIAGWTAQPQYMLGHLKYVADFAVEHVGGGVHAEDVKGYETAHFRRVVRKLWPIYGPHELRIIRCGQTTDTLPGAPDAPVAP